MRSTRRGNYKDTKEVIGRPADMTVGISTRPLFYPKTRYTVELKAIIMVIMERNRVIRPIISLLGRA